VFGRVSGDSASAYLLQQASSLDKAAGRLGAVTAHLLETRVRVDPGQNKVNLEFSWDGQNASSSAFSPIASSSSSGPAPQLGEQGAGAPAQAQAGEEKAAASAGDKKSGGASGEYTAADVAKHNKKDDVWVIVDGQVLDVTKVS